MREIKELGRAVAEADAWIDDLAQRLGWHDRGKAYAALIGALHGLRDALSRDEVAYFGAQLPPLLGASTMKAGAPAPIAPRKASRRFAHAFTRPWITILALTRKQPPAPFSLCLRPAYRRARSRM